MDRLGLFIGVAMVAAAALVVSSTSKTRTVVTRNTKVQNPEVQPTIPQKQLVAAFPLRFSMN